MRLRVTPTSQRDIPRDFFAPLLEDYHETCATMDLAPEHTEHPSRIKAEASAPITLEHDQIGRLSNEIRFS